MTSATTTSARLPGLAATIAAFPVLAAALIPQQVFAGASLLPLDRWILSALALALYVFGYSLRRGAAAFGVLAFFFIMGGAAQLYITEARWFPTLHLQPQNGREWLMAAIIAAEAVVGLVALSRMGLGALLAEAGKRLGWGRIAILVALTFAFSVPIQAYVWRGAATAYFAHVLVGGLLLIIHLVVLITMSLVKSPVSGVHRISPIVPAIFAVVASIVLGAVAFEQMPRHKDEVAYLFQASTFASGALTMPAPPEAAQPGLEYFLTDFRDGRWFSATLPGWPALLAIGALLGVPWLINPILAGVTVMLAYDIAHRKVGRDQADLVALMVGSSPWLLAGAASLMPHTLTLTLMLFAWWMVLRAPKHGRMDLRRLVIAGAAIGWIILTRPLDGLVVGALTALWIFAGPGGSVRRALPFMIGLAVIGLLLPVFNAAMTGTPFTMPSTHYFNTHWFEGANAYGFGSEIGRPDNLDAVDLWPGHSPLEALVNIHNLLDSLQLEMLGWSIGSLALVYAFLLWQRPVRQFDAAMLAMIAAIILGTAPYWFADSFYFGPRYWYLAAFPLLYISARGYDAMRMKFPGRNEEGFIRIDSILGLCCLFGLLVFTPWRGIVKYHEHGEFHSTVKRAEARGEFGNAIVLVEQSGDKGSWLYLNSPSLDGPGPIFLTDTGSLDVEALKAAFPGRDVVRYETGWTAVAQVP